MTHLRRLLIVAGLLALGIVFLPNPVFATDPPADPAGPVKLDDTIASLQLSATLVNAVINGFIPIVTGLLSRSTWRLKGLITLALSTIASMVVTGTMADGTAIISQQAALNAVVGFLVAVASYVSIWRPARVTSSVIATPGTPVVGALANRGVK